MTDFIEYQHRLIDKTLEKLRDVIVNRDDSKYDPKVILDELIFYYDIHFYTENKLIEKYLNEDQIKLHEKEHKDFLDRLISLRSKECLTIDIYVELKKWAENHITNMDQKLYYAMNSYSTLPTT